MTDTPFFTKSSQSLIPFGFPLRTKNTFVAGAFLMFLILVLGDFVVQIPMPVLAGVMVVVCITQFDWHSFKYAVTAPKKDVFVMLLTIVVVLYTHNLAIGVVAGIVVSALFFVNEISRVKIIPDGSTYFVTGQLFFASTESFIEYFKVQKIEEPSIRIDFTQCKVWDDSAIGSLLKVKDLLKAKNIQVTYHGMDVWILRLHICKSIIDQGE